MKKRRLRIDRILICLIVLALILFLVFFLIGKVPKKKPKFQEYDRYVASNNLKTKLYDINYTETSEITRGQKVTILEDKIDNMGTFYYKVRYNDTEYLILEEDLVEDIKDAVLEKEMYVNISATMYKDSETSKIESFISKGKNVEVIDFDKLNENGTVNMYKIRYNNTEGYVYSKYLLFDETLKEENEYDKYHENRKFSFELYGGSTKNLDYSYREKPKFENNVMPQETRTLYLNGSSGVLAKIDDYITLAKNNNINAFVVDIKDGYMSYESEVAKKYSNSNYKSYSNKLENYKKAIDKLKENGFYVIGRIVAFNDSLFAKDNPTETISSPSGVNTSWVSAYSRLAWEFNVELAKEAVNEFGFNEIQFDYVRFPEASYGYSRDNYNFKNKYNEEKAQAIQNFLMYATDEIHKLNVYVSADVFGECSGTYVTAYGQYWPAISNVVDVISSMPYPDHFAKGSYGLAIPWEQPYSLMKSWASQAAVRQTEIPSPAKARTWIQAYNAIYPPYITYDSQKISDQIQGLYDGGLKDGYITWNAASSYDKYTSIAPAFRKDY